VQQLESLGYAKLFGPGTHTDDIAKYIETTMNARWAKEGASR